MRLKLLVFAFAAMVSASGYGSRGQADSVSAKAAADTIIRSGQLEEVVVTASERVVPSTTSRIVRSAIAHLQPSSFTDLLELLPGNISRNPDLSSVNSISLRETGTLDAQGNRYTSSDYAITSLGTLFMVDGAPLNTDAGLQSEGLTVSDASSPAAAAITTNRGVDMRTISTDNIESVEIVRGIPSAEYGNLTSGVVNIRRIRRSIPFTFRFKADECSKLFSAAKGIGVHNDRHILNIDFGFLDFRSDPRVITDGYRRITASVRMNMRFGNDDMNLVWNYGADYTGGLDRSRIDPDLNYNKVDEFRSTYGRYALTSNLTLSLNPGKAFNHFNLSTSASLEVDRLHRLRQVALSRPTVAPTSMSAGESIGAFLPGEYMATYLSDGRPFSLFLKGVARGSRNSGEAKHSYMAGLEWTCAKNFGHGQVYDLSRPISGSWTTRPRAFSDIPAVHVLNFFIEDDIHIPLKESLLEVQAGMRTIQLPGLNKRYYLHGRIYLDPRVNLLWTLPQYTAAGKSLKVYFGAGYGLTTRMPTADYLYPQQSYSDFLQLNYYDAANPQRSCVSLMTYINDATNYNLRPARNRKLELRAGMNWGPVSLQVSAFIEKMTDGFRYSSNYAPYYYKQYDASALSSQDIPNLSSLPYTEKTVLSGYRYASNGTRILKKGIEFTANTKRWQALHTSLTVTGAWFRTEYSNSQDLFQTVNDVVGNTHVSDMYVGLYHTRDGRINEQFNTNFMFDTQLKRPALILTTTFQFMWFVKTRTIPENGRPVQYLATDGQLHPYDDAAADDVVLKFLEKQYNDALYRTQRVPLAMYVNLKVTKPIGRHVRVALFVNRIIDYLPDYKSNGLTIRRNSDSYFGMELNLTI